MTPIFVKAKYVENDIQMSKFNWQRIKEQDNAIKYREDADIDTVRSSYFDDLRMTASTDQLEKMRYLARCILETIENVNYNVRHEDKKKDGLLTSLKKDIRVTVEGKTVKTNIEDVLRHLNLIHESWRSFMVKAKFTIANQSILESLLAEFQKLVNETSPTILNIVIREKM